MHRAPLDVAGGAGMRRTAQQRTHPQIGKSVPERIRCKSAWAQAVVGGPPPAWPTR